MQKKKYMWSLKDTTKYFRSSKRCMCTVIRYIFKICTNPQIMLQMYEIFEQNGASSKEICNIMSVFDLLHFGAGICFELDQSCQPLSYFL